jgi:hypothetical protein
VSGEPLDQLIRQTDPEGCHVINLPSRIWIFGGASDDDAEKPLSLRDSFWRQSLQSWPVPIWIKDLDKPEAHQGWLEFSGYTNLLEFERDACYLARGVILFAESPGSFAELGALAIDSSILPRLHVVVQTTYLEEDKRRSFLNLGPFRLVGEKDGLCGIIATKYPLIEVHEFETILESVDGWLPKSRHKERFNASNSTHLLLIISDLVDLLLVSKEEDILRALLHFQVNIGVEELRRYLNLLSFFRLVIPRLNGRRPYYVRHQESEAPWIDYTGIAPSAFDRSRFKIAAREAVERNAVLRDLFEAGG